MNKKMKTNKQIFFELKKLIKNSIAPYSHFNVASIIYTDKGYFSGVNYEDYLLNLGICAERNAIFNGVTNGIKKIKQLHLLTSNKNGEVNMCGACRQLLSSFMDYEKDEIYVYDANGKFKKYSLKQLLPIKPH